MGRTYKVGSSGSFGARYGTVPRKRYSTVIAGLRTPHECPQCHVIAVKRMSVGVWFCRRCGFKFVGGAYVPRTKLGEIAERASRSGVASSLLAELKAERARQVEVQVKAKAPAKRRRRKTIEKAEPRKPNVKGSEDKPPDRDNNHPAE